MRILVTGAAGFIGSHLVDRLRTDGNTVTGVDDLSGGTLANVPHEPAGEGGEDAFVLLRGDVRDPSLAETLATHEPEVICHLAAQVNVRRSVADPLGDARANVLGTLTVLEAARQAGTRKIVFASSVAIYGVPAGLPVPGHAAPDPRSPYAASKLSGESYLMAYRALYGIDFTTLVLGNVYGPRQTPHGEAGVVAIFTDALLRREPTRVYGDGEQTRDYVYVADVVDAFACACGTRGGGQRVNVGTGVQTSDKELHRKVARAAGVREEPALAPHRPGDLPAMVVDPVPARQVLEWSPHTTLDQGIAATVDWHRRRLGNGENGRHAS